MEIKIQIWGHKQSGERYAVKVQNGRVIDASGPLYYKDVPAMREDFDGSDPDLVYDLDEDQDSYILIEPKDDYRD